MIWKLFFLLTYTQFVISHGKRHNLQPSYQTLVQLMYDNHSEDVTYGEDVGEPLILTPFIMNNSIHEAREAARVDDKTLLPGVESYAAYLTVNSKYNGNLFFWYFPVAQKSVEKTPLIIWLQGGPGASSLFGLFEEVGPFKTVDRTTIRDNEYSWGKNHSLLFIDNPVGTGFSFTDDDGYAQNQTTIGENLYSALQQFLTVFPELRSAPLFITGESYAGKHIPSLGIQIHWHKNDKNPINLQGLAIGNGFIDPLSIQRYSYFVREAGLVDDKIADKMKSIESNVSELINQGKIKSAFHEELSLWTIFRNESNLINLYNYLKDTLDLEGNYTKFIQSPKLRRALHVGNTSFSAGKVYDNLIPDFMNSVKPWLEELLDHYRVLLYNGHLDCMVPYHASVNTYNSLKFSGSKDYKNAMREPWLHNDILAGYVKRGGKLTDVMVRGAGHMVPQDEPQHALALITAFVQNISLTEDTGNLVH